MNKDRQTQISEYSPKMKTHKDERRIRQMLGDGLRCPYCGTWNPDGKWYGKCFKCGEDLSRA